MFEDNEACIVLAGDAVHSDCTKHIDICFPYLRERVRDQMLQMIKVSSFQQLADAMTKAVGATIFICLRDEYVRSRDRL
eukprot:666760-Rhodomonas_salina.1